MKKIELDTFKGATSRTARDINRRVVLNLVRQRQPISRAEPARHSGLQRSTISAPNLKWHDLDLKPPLENATGLPVVLENAANACAWPSFGPDGIRLMKRGGIR